MKKVLVARDLSDYYEKYETLTVCYEKMSDYSSFLKYNVLYLTLSEDYKEATQRTISVVGTDGQIV